MRWKSSRQNPLLRNLWKTFHSKINKQIWSKLSCNNSKPDLIFFYLFIFFMACQDQFFHFEPNLSNRWGKGRSLREIICQSTSENSFFACVVPMKFEPTQLYEPHHEKTCFCQKRPTKVQISLISTFVVRCLDSIISLVSISKISSL